MQKAILIREKEYGYKKHEFPEFSILFTILPLMGAKL